MEIPWLDFNHYDAVLGALAMLVILSLLLERALAVVFEWGGWEKGIAKWKLKAPIALVVSYVICGSFDFDILSILFASEAGYSGDFTAGTIITAAVIAGGSKGAILLFQGVLGFGQEAVNARIHARANLKLGGGDAGGREVAGDRD